MKQSREKWGDLELKTKIAYLTALIAFVIGWGLTIAGFFVAPLGVVSDSVLWILGQSLVYAASVFGVGMYVTGSVRGMKASIRHFMREEQMHRNNLDYIEEEYEDRPESEIEQ